MIFEIMKLVWPFLKEFFLGKEVSMGQAVKKGQWKRLGMLFLVSFSLLANLFLIPKSVILSDDVYKLELQCRQYQCGNTTALKLLQSDGFTKPASEASILSNKVSDRGVTASTVVTPNPAPPTPEPTVPPMVASTPAASGSSEYWKRYNSTLNRFSDMK